MSLSGEEIEKLRPKLRFKVSYELGFLCPDIDDVVQETIARYLTASKDDKLRNPDAAGAFLNGICRNVISEYRRRSYRDEPMPEVVPEPPGKSIAESELFELRQAIARGMEQLPDRDRRILRAFYLEEKTKEEILHQTGMTDQNFRVVLFRAKEKFRAIYLEQTKHRATLGHSII
ncbi:MAG TPA: sigma-70 family RNA polymerase sigma factor [Bryobacteraceae bacterium]|nr:sigma-70 family RNA polymerase sigma factor [Bryobacteraceae bacterium]